MSTSAGANRATGRMLLQQPSRAIAVPPRTDQLPPGDHRRPRETETGNIVRRSVERTFAWLGRNRRLAKDFEATVASAVTMAYLASLQLLVRRLARA
jgi:transposase